MTSYIQYKIQYKYNIQYKFRTNPFFARLYIVQMAFRALKLNCHKTGSLSFLASSVLGDDAVFVELKSLNTYLATIFRLLLCRTRDWTIDTRNVICGSPFPLFCSLQYNIKNVCRNVQWSCSLCNRRIPNVTRVCVRQCMASEQTDTDLWRCCPQSNYANSFDGNRPIRGM